MSPFLAFLESGGKSTQGFSHGRQVLSTMELRLQSCCLISASGISNTPVTVNIFLQKGGGGGEARKLHTIRLDGHVPNKLYLLAQEVLRTDCDLFS